MDIEQWTSAILCIQNIFNLNRMKWKSNCLPIYVADKQTKKNRGTSGEMKCKSMASTKN